MRRYRVEDVSRSQYVRVFKDLFHGPYVGLSNDERMAYALILDRISWSKQNNWVNAKNEVYVYFSAKNLAELFHLSTKTVYRILGKLRRAHLIESERQGLGKPNKLYVCLPEPAYEQYKSPRRDSNEAPCLSSDHSDGTDVSNSSLNLGLSDGKKVHPNKTDVNNTKGNKTDKEYKPDVSVYTPCSPNTIPPDRRSVADYCTARQNQIDPDEFIDYYTARGWVNVKDWQAQIRQWERREKIFDKKRHHDGDEKSSTDALYEMYLKEDEANGF